MIELREYQERAKEGIRAAFRAGHRAALLVMPTGAGKTITAASMLSLAVAKGTQTLWVADRRELVEQASEAFTALGVGHGLIMPGEAPAEDEMLLVGTLQSFLARHRRGIFQPEHIKMICLDEAHRSESRTIQELLALYPNARVVGLTATPIRGDGKGLGNTFGAMCQPTTIKALLAENRLIPPRYHVPSELDLMGLQKRKGEYNQKELDLIAENNPQLVGDVVSNFARICPERRAVAFPCNIKHSIALRDAFNVAGIPAVHIDGATPTVERKARMADFRAGVYQVLTSVNIAIEGLDVPDVSCVIFARPTKSVRLWVQGVGRGLRAYPGQTECIVLDHAGTTLSLGPAEDFDEWILEDGQGKEASGGSRKKEPRAPKDITCEECAAVFYGSKVCPACGHVHIHERAPRDVGHVSGDLQELTPEGRVELKRQERDKQIWWAGLQWHVAAKGYKPGAAYRMYIEKWAVPPGSWQNDIPPSPPSAEVRAWLDAKRRAYAEKMRRENGPQRVRVAPNTLLPTPEQLVTNPLPEFDPLRREVERRNVARRPA